MAVNKYTLIGVDGGATKVSGWIITVLKEKQSFSLSAHGIERTYSSLNGHLNNFTPVEISEQLRQRERGTISISDEESAQGENFIRAAGQVIKDLFKLGENKPVLIGIGMPGLKTDDHRGINAIANGPRMPDYCSILENYLKHYGVELLAPLFHLGSDADYCGLGEFYAGEGSFRNTYNAYYLGGGTGAADALLLKGQLIAFDNIRSWMAKTWEMKNDLGISFERYASASGLQSIYAGHSNKSLELLKKSNIHSPQIASLALKGDDAAIKSYQEAAVYLAQLIFERISTLYCGSLGILKFVNSNRTPLDPVHEFRGERFEKIVIGQRLGELMASPGGYQVLTAPFLDALSQILRNTTGIPQSMARIYLNDDVFDKTILIFSKLRQAPALGAGIDAHLNYFNR